MLLGFASSKLKKNISPISEITQITFNNGENFKSLIASLCILMLFINLIFV